MFRAQTAPATILLILVPYLTITSLFSLEALTIGLFALFAHWISFGHNSLMDTAMNYDVLDKNKAHHPLVAGRISLHAAHNVIHWSLCGLAVAATVLSLTVSPNPFMALTSVFLWFVFGYAYNSGLSKESLLGFVPISVCFTAMAAWGWFLSHNNLNMTGWLYLGYVFFLILFQISFSGNLKELEIKEKSNILVKMGAQVSTVNGEKRFTPGKAWFFAWFVKGFTLLFGYLLLWQNYNPLRLMITIFFSALVITSLYKLTKPRPYIRHKELMSMSVMEILTIYLVLWLMLDPVTAIILEIFGVAYFFGINKLIWTTPYPAV